MIKPIQQNEDLVRDIAEFQGTDSFKVWWLGQSGFLIKWHGKHLLFDPYLSDSLSVKYANTDKPHTRVSELVIEPELLPRIDIVTSSHNHTDHLDADTLKPILAKNVNVKFIIPEANRIFVAERVGCAIDFPLGLNDTEEFDYEGFKIIGIPAAHNSIDRDENGNLRFMGFIVKFGKYAVYHSGDTLWFEGLDDILKKHTLDVAFLPINGNKPERRVAGNLSFQEAADLGKAIGCKWVIPHHYDLFVFNTENPENFVNACTAIGVNHKVLKLGEGFEIELLASM
jgi:L-ascorbate metabolism protein UlaG (beta-lactamase superfamily)